MEGESAPRRLARSGRPRRAGGRPAKVDRQSDEPRVAGQLEERAVPGRCEIAAPAKREDVKAQDDRPREREQPAVKLLPALERTAQVAQIFAQLFGRMQRCFHRISIVTLYYRVLYDFASSFFFLPVCA
jgi:hypothetical protein